MEDNLNFMYNGRRHKFSYYLENGRQRQFVGKMEDDLKYLAKWKTTSIISQNGRQPQF